jgi:5-methylcytosine-specific restriction endonuclease McrA
MNKQKLKYYCKCGNKITSRTALYGLGNCQKCKGKLIRKAKLGKIRPLEVRHKISKATIGRIPWNKNKQCPQLMGNNNGSWKGGITSLILKLRNSLLYASWRNKIFKRDDYTCQECFKKGVYLEAHHIKSFANLLRIYKIKTLKQAFACKALWKTSLGKSLCLKCHDKTKGRKRCVST